MKLYILAGNSKRKHVRLSLFNGYSSFPGFRCLPVSVLQWWWWRRWSSLTERFRHSLTCSQPLFLLHGNVCLLRDSERKRKREREREACKATKKVLLKKHSFRMERFACVCFLDPYNPRWAWFGVRVCWWKLAKADEYGKASPTNLNLFSKQRHLWSLSVMYT